jgi:hypothetical protein
VPRGDLTTDELATFRRDGFLLAADVMPSRDLEVLRSAVARFEERTPPNKTSSYYNYADILGIDDAFTALVEHEQILPRMVGFLGFNLYVNHSHINVDLPKPDDEAFTWHRDGAMVHWDLPARPIPMLGLKVGIALTALDSDVLGNTFIIPGSHEDGDMPLPPHGHRDPRSVPIVGPAGTIFFFDPRAIHCRSPNRSQHVRRMIFLQFAFRWLRPLDGMSVGELAQDAMSPVRRQLLGLTMTETRARRAGSWYASDDDVPLRRWALERWGNVVEDRVGRLVGYPRGWSTRPLPDRPSQYSR